MRHSLGRVVATAAVAASVPEAVIIALLDRHASGDWGDLGEEDQAINVGAHQAALDVPGFQLRHSCRAA